jgi:hypothetical protein
MKPLHYLFLATGILLILFTNSCKKQEYVDPRPDFTTGDTSQIGENSATLTGRLIKLNGGAIEKSGHVWSSLNDVPDLSINEGSTVLGGFTTDSNSYSSALNNLRPNTTYFVRGYMEREGLTWYGNIILVKTNKEKILEVVTGVDSLKTFNSSLLSGYIFDLGKSAVTAYGHVWSATSTTPTTADSKTNLGSLATVPRYFLSTLTNLVPATTYYFRAYGINTQGTFYGVVQSFRTSNAPLPAVTTSTIGGSNNIITVNATVTANGVPAATQHGFVYSKTNSTPTIADTRTSQGVPGAAPFNYMASLGGLDYSATYYVRAYVTSTAGTFYGAVLSRSTATAVLPSVNTRALLLNHEIFIQGNGTLLSSGTFPVTEHGFVYSGTVAVPTTANIKVNLGVPGAVPLNFDRNIGPLNYSTTYYVRAYAISAAGTAYGQTLNATTTAAPVNNPAVSTDSVARYSNTGFDARGKVINNGSPTGTQHGFVYSRTNSSPTISDSKVMLGVPPAAPSFFSSIVLVSFGDYYVRAFITNANGTFYGSVKLVTVR